jgi:hypothetical protein
MQLSHSFTSLQQFKTCPKQYWHYRIVKDVTEEEGEASLDGKRQHKSLEDRIKDGTPLPPNLSKHEGLIQALLSSGLEVKAEQELAITKELEPCDWWHPDVFLRVKADVGLYSKTTAGLLDWKSGKRSPKVAQLELGALAQFVHYPKVKSTKAAFLWLRDDATDDYKFTRADDYDRIKTSLMTSAQRIEDAVVEDVWQAKPGYHCNWCAAKDICTASQAKK